MKLNQALGLHQSFKLSTEMKTAIDMLALSTQEICHLVEQELEDNPCLEEVEVENCDYFSPSFDNHTNFESHTESRSSSYDIALETYSEKLDFRDYLIKQICLNKFNILEKHIADYIIYNLDDDGILTDPEQVYTQIIAELAVFPEWIDSVRWRIMQLDPPGCAAKSINESLRSQITQLRPELIYKSKAIHALLKLLAHLGENPDQKLNLREIRQLCGREDVIILKKISPRPARAWLNYSTTFEQANWQPDLVLQKHQHNFFIYLTKKYSSKIIINNNIKNNLTNNIKNKYKQANLFVKSLRFREESLLLVAKAITEQQSAWFFQEGEIKPLILADIARQTGLHESSISRLVNNKYIASERGVYELKYFFSQGLKSVNNQDKISSINIKNHINLLIKQENKTKPLLDQEISQELKTKNIIISRRTISKYRSILKIPGAAERRIVG